MGPILDTYRVDVNEQDQNRWKMMPGRPQAISAEHLIAAPLNVPDAYVSFNSGELKKHSHLFL